MHQLPHIYAIEIVVQEAPLDSFFGIIICTKIRMCIPGFHNSFQRGFYKGHNKIHRLIYQTISTTDGLAFPMYLREAGRLHDMTLANGTSLKHTIFMNVLQYYIFGENTYLLRPWIQWQYLTMQQGSVEAMFNTIMSFFMVLQT